MTSEIIQLAVMLLAFLVVSVLWIFVIYLPGRTMEGRWEGDRAERLEEARLGKVEPETRTTL